MSGEKIYWIPLESNPDVMNQFLHGLGVLPGWQFYDCFGLEPELLAFVPQPCIAVIISFPYDKLKPEKNKEREKIEKDGQEVSPNVYFMKQLIENACGTIALIHSIANNTNRLKFSHESAIKQFIESTKTKTPVERGEALSRNKDIAQLHVQAARSGETETPAEDAEVESHFVCFCEVDGCLYELDGTKQFPINHGKISPNGFLQDAANVIKTKFIDKVSNDIRFTMIALCSSQ
jgi:ubiquitin carboxyl-terminal hydrolase L3